MKYMPRCGAGAAVHGDSGKVVPQVAFIKALMVVKHGKKFPDKIQDLWRVGKLEELVWLFIPA